MIENKWLSKLSLRKMTTLLVLLSVFVSLIASAALLHNYVVERENEIVKEKLKNIGRIVAKDPRIIEEVSRGSIRSVVQDYTMDVMETTNVNFIVVLNNQLIRLSHPDKTVIGKPFSNIEDAKKSLNGEEHYSREEGILGEGTRFFTPIWDEEGEQIGIVCVGYVQETINKELWDAQKNIYIGLSVGLFFGLLGALYLARQLKKILLGLEPKEIAATLKEREFIKESVSEGIIAIAPDRKILLYNNNFTNVMEKAKFTEEYMQAGYLSEDIFSILFKEAFQTKQPIYNQVIVFNQLELIVSVKLIYVKEKTYGAVATIRDQSDMQQLIRELSGTEQYVDSLRAQNHKFMNQLHTILGLIELEKYEDVIHFIRVLDTDYRHEIGFVTEKIKSPAIAGFLLGKSSEFKEQGVLLKIDSDSNFPDMKMGELLHDLLISIGVLLDNAKEAVKLSDKKQVKLFLYYDSDEEVILIEVHDTGEGMEEQLITKIFSRGFSTKGEKRGYGLDAVKSIANRYDGIVDVRSKIGKGSIFRIELPYKRGNSNE
ncbi:ATP-binding protein [Bacillus chungangensis]|uniref:histidine kinase n=1 Tax=Bacillus chungangensis TaxID=587633 RepID=A0ABT9WLZ3_9BACI|nr:ATP-binding protein [Bacillus chungangensis]MDQ0174226.1 CitB family two-component system sensor histidine kinase MalK [Bacillus chungangensis]